jgi:hypothetical protein
MVDYFINKMKIYGDRKDLETFNDEVILDKNWGLIFNNLIPMPEDLSKWDERGEDSGWYFWQLENWGVVWAERLTYVTDKGKYLNFVFENLYDAPIPIFETLIERYPTLNFEIKTYDPTDALVLEMVSEKGQLKVFTRFEYIRIDLKNGRALNCMWIEVDYLNQRTKVLKKIR